MKSQLPNTSAHSAFAGVKVVMFDVDNTLWDFRGNSPLALRHVFDVTPEVNRYVPYELFALHYERRNGELWRLYHHGLISKEYLVNERFRYALAASGCLAPGSVGLAAAMNVEYLRYLALLPGAVAGAAELLEYLRKAGYRMCVVSNGFVGTQEQKLRSAGLLSYFDAVVLSEAVGVTKPFAGIYEAACQAMRCEASEAVMVGDDYEADIEGAASAGLRTIYFRRPASVPPAAAASVATATVTSLAAIRSLL